MLRFLLGRQANERFVLTSLDALFEMEVELKSPLHRLNIVHYISSGGSSGRTGNQPPALRNIHRSARPQASWIRTLKKPARLLATCLRNLITPPHAYAIRLVLACDGRLSIYLLFARLYPLPSPSPQLSCNPNQMLAQDLRYAARRGEFALGALASLVG